MLYNYEKWLWCLRFVNHWMNLCGDSNVCIEYNDREIIMTVHFYWFFGVYISVYTRGRKSFGILVTKWLPSLSDGRTWSHFLWKFSIHTQTHTYSHKSESQHQNWHKFWVYIVTHTKATTFYRIDLAAITHVFFFFLSFFPPKKIPFKIP